MPVSPPPFNVASGTRPFVNHIHHFTTRFIATPIGAFVAWLTIHTSVAYFVLFAGAYLDALIGPSLFIPGEVIFLGGSILGGQGILNIWFAIAVIYAGGILGDSSSYWIGRLLGTTLHTRTNLLKGKQYHRVKRFVDRYGAKALFFARLVGPFSKIAPVTAGVLEIPFPQFLLYNIPGVIVGIGEFLIVGYFFGDKYEQVLGLLERYLVVFFALATLIGLGVWQYMQHRSQKRRARHAHSPQEKAVDSEQAG